MKTKIVFIVFVVLFSCTCFAQESEKTIKINNYIEMMERYKKYSYDDFLRLVKQLDDNIIKREAKIIYEAIEIAPIDVFIILEDDFKNEGKLFESKKKEKGHPQLLALYKFVQRDILCEVKERFGDLANHIIYNPIILKAKVLSHQETDDYWDSIKDKKLCRKILRLSVEEVLKGVVDFIKQKEIEVFYRNWEDNKADDFIAGASYLFYLYVEQPNDKYPFAVNVLVDKMGSRFLIKEDFFPGNPIKNKQMAERNWNQKKNEILSSINSVKTMTEKNIKE